MSNQAARQIRLRRPPTLSRHDTPFVPSRMRIDEVDARWEELRTLNPAYFDGSIYHVLGVHRNGHGGAVIHVAPCTYRYHAVQRDGIDLGVRPLGVKGVVVRDGRILLGRRGRHVAHYAKMWEFAPGGVVEVDSTPERTIGTELEEEVRLTLNREPIALGIIFDPILRSWEVIYQLSVPDDQHPAKTDEYPDVMWCEMDALPSPLSPLASEMVPLVTRCIAQSTGE